MTSFYRTKLGKEDVLWFPLKSLHAIFLLFRISQSSSRVSLFPHSVAARDWERQGCSEGSLQRGISWGSQDQPSPPWSNCDHSSWGTNLWLLRVVILLLAKFLETCWQQTYYMSSGASWLQPVDPCLFRIRPYVKIQGVGTGVLGTENCSNRMSLEIRDTILDSLFNCNSPLVCVGGDDVIYNYMI